jgi:lipopolysaccharide heptosyltransferase I
MNDKRFLVLRLSAVGDVLRTLPAVKVLKEKYPSSSITWVVEEPSKTLLESQPEVDEVILFPRRRWTEAVKSPKRMGVTLAEVWRFIRNLRMKRFDVVLDFHGILKSGLISFLSGAPKRIGYDRKSSREGNFLFSNIKVTLPAEKISRFKRNFALLQGLGLEAKNVNPSLSVPKRDKEYVKSFFQTLPIPVRRPLIAVHTGTSPTAPFKRWMPQKYSKLADRLIRELGATVLFTWGPGELEWVEGIRNEMEEPSILGPKTESLTQLGEVFRYCDLYIGGDTGPMHIASMMGIPAVVIYGPTDPIFHEPYGEHKKVRKEVGCNPCRDRFCKEVTCMKIIEDEDVLKATKEILRLTH